MGPPDPRQMTYVCVFSSARLSEDARVCCEDVYRLCAALVLKLFMLWQEHNCPGHLEMCCIPESCDVLQPRHLEDRCLQPSKHHNGDLMPSKREGPRQALGVRTIKIMAGGPVGGVETTDYYQTWPSERPSSALGLACVQACQVVLPSEYRWRPSGWLCLPSPSPLLSHLWTSLHTIRSSMQEMHNCLQASTLQGSGQMFPRSMHSQWVAEQSWAWTLFVIDEHDVHTFNQDSGRRSSSRMRAAAIQIERDIQRWAVQACDSVRAAESSICKIDSRVNDLLRWTSKKVGRISAPNAFLWFTHFQCEDIIGSLLVQFVRHTMYPHGRGEIQLSALKSSLKTYLLRLSLHWEWRHLVAPCPSLLPSLHPSSAILSQSLRGSLWLIRGPCALDTPYQWTHSNSSFHWTAKAQSVMDCRSSFKLSESECLDQSAITLIRPSEPMMDVGAGYQWAYALARQIEVSHINYFGRECPELINELSLFGAYIIPCRPQYISNRHVKECTTVTIVLWAHWYLVSAVMHGVAVFVTADVHRLDCYLLIYCDICLDELDMASITSNLLKSWQRFRCIWNVSKSDFGAPLQQQLCHCKANPIRPTSQEDMLAPKAVRSTKSRRSSTHDWIWDTLKMTLLSCNLKDDPTTSEALTCFEFSLTLSYDWYNLYLLSQGLCLDSRLILVGRLQIGNF